VLRQGQPPIAINPLSSVQVVVVDGDVVVREHLMAELGEGARAVDSLVSLEPELRGQPVVVVLGPASANPEGLAEAAQALYGRREVATVLVADELSADVLHMALRSGVRDVIAVPIDSRQLLEAVARVGQELLPAEVALIDSTKRPGFGDGVADEQGRVTTVFSTKGGAGKSMLAVNLGVALARKKPERPVVLVDADLQFGDVAVMLKLAPRHTIVDAIGSLDDLDSNLLRHLLMRHEPSGLLVLAAPLEPSFADQIQAAEVAEIISVLRTFCSHVVVDTPGYFNEVVLGLLEESDDILMIAGMDIPNIKNVKVALQTLRLLNIPVTKLHFVLNRANSRVKLDVAEVEKTLQLKADLLIPSDIAVPQSVNRGTPVVLDARKSGVARAIERLANMFVADDAARRAG
jgi:pilus assembly protein CpaE